jgi:rhomboid protease GluP
MHNPQPGGQSNTQPPATGFPTQVQFYLKLAPPTVTKVLIGANLLVFVAMIAYGKIAYDTWTGPETIDVLVLFGAKVNILIKNGEYWRLFTAMFIHIGVLHLLFNLYALYAIGPLVEGYFGHIRFIVIYVLAGLFGSLASYAMSPAISAGASGAIFGLIGAVTVYFLKYHQNFGQRGRAMLQNMAIIIVINLAFGMAGNGIDNWGHIGGLIGGAAVSWGLLPRYQPPALVRPGAHPLETERRDVFESAWTLLMIALFVIGVQFAGQITPTIF